MAWRTHLRPAWFEQVPAELRDAAARDLAEIEAGSPVHLLEERKDGESSRWVVRPAEAVVRFREEPAPGLFAELGLAPVERLGWEPGLWWVRFVPPGDDPELAAERLRLEPFAADLWPVDYVLGRRRTVAVGDLAPGTPVVLPCGADRLGVPAAWSRARGAGALVTVIDAGFRPKQSQILPALVAERSAVFGPSANPFVPGLAGLKQTGNSIEHGTWCAGLIAARPRPRCPVGLAPEARLGLVALRNEVLVSQLDLARALHFAIDPRRGAATPPVRPSDAVSCSLDLSAMRPLEPVLDRLLAACRQLIAGGGAAPVLCFAATYDPKSLPPPVLAGTGVLPVGVAGWRHGKLAKVQGCQQVAILAPGESCPVVSVDESGFLSTAGGTSIATPLVAGAVALLRSAYPTAPPSRLLEALLRGARPVDGQLVQPDAENGWGDLAVDRSLALLAGAPQP